MPRPRIRRRVRGKPGVTYYKPRRIPMHALSTIALSYEEYEAMRLKNLKMYDQILAAKKMNTSQSTFQRILQSAYAKIALAIETGAAISIEKE